MMYLRRVVLPLVFLLATLLAHSSWAGNDREQDDRSLDDRKVKRDLQKLDNSAATFDFFKKDRVSDEISDEQSLLQALELLERNSSVSYSVTDEIIIDNDISNVSIDDSVYPEDIEDELESNMDQELSESMFELLEEFEFDEEEDQHAD